MKQLIKDKFKAFLIHISISICIVTCLYFFIRQWYPLFYFDVLNILPIFLMLIGVDVFIGPLLTLVVYKKNKPGLFFDLFIIISLQFTAFSYGSYTVYTERPLFLIYSVDRFIIVTANSINSKDIKNPEFLLNSPQILAAHMPETTDEKNKLVMSVLSGGPDIEYQPNQYETLSNQKNLLLAKGLTIEQLQKYSKVSKKIKKEEQQYNNEQLLAFPLVNTKGKDWLLLFDIKTMEIVQLIDTDPWAIGRLLKAASKNK